MQKVYEKGPWDIWRGSEFWPNSHSLHRSPKTLVVSQCTHCAHKTIRVHSISHSVILDHLQSIPSRCSDTEACHLWCFSLADLIVEVQTAARAPLCSLLFRYSQTEQNEGALAREDKPRTKTTLVNRREQYSNLGQLKLIQLTKPILFGFQTNNQLKERINRLFSFDSKSTIQNIFKTLSKTPKHKTIGCFNKTTGCFSLSLKNTLNLKDLKTLKL